MSSISQEAQHTTRGHVLIIGAGLVGSLLSIYLSRQGYRVTLYERRDDMRKAGVAAGRSINLALSDRGIRALEEVGIMHLVKAIAIPMHGRQIHHTDNSITYQAYGQEGQYINSVSRRELNCTLMTAAEAHGATILFQHKCQQVRSDTGTVVFEHTATGETVTAQGDLVFGSDGAFSAARLQQQLQSDRFDYQQSYIDFGYKELTIPAGDGGQFQMEPNALHIWPRGNYMLIALPNPDGSFTCTLFFPFEGEPSFASLDTQEKVQAFFSATFADATALIPELTTAFFNNPTASLVTVKCFPWVKDGRVALIGDAAHAIVPFFGQGMNCGFEDCTVLNALIDQHDHDWTKILPLYQELRKPDADAIAALALNNFIEMRDKVADPLFQLQKKIEARFSQKYPDKWIPAYAQVTFSPHIRYSEALRNGERQEAIMQDIMARPDIVEQWDSPEIEQMILSRLEAAV
jgi:kynurenine 3-monooxygenase